MRIRSVPTAALERIVHAAFPTCRVLATEPLTDGLRNTNLKLHLDTSPEPVVLRIYEHDPSLCQKELDLMRLVSPSVPVPEIIHAEPAGLDDLPPFTLSRWIEAITFRDLKRTGDRDAIAQAAYAAGEVLAAIGQFRFPKPGWIVPGPAIGSPLMEGPDPFPRFVDLCLASPYLQTRVPAELRDRTHDLAWSSARPLAAIDDEARLVHGDFSKRNLLVSRKAGRWSVAAVLDWEFAFSGAPLADLGNFLRYERASHPVVEPDFSAGYLSAGGHLPRDWRRLARWVDLAALCEILTRPELPASVVPELLELMSYD